MRTRLIAGAAVLVLVGGGVVLFVQQNDTACERLEAANARDEYASFAEQQGELAKAIAECMAEEAGLNR